MRRWYWWVLGALAFLSAFAFRYVPDIASQPVFSYVFVVLVALPSLFFLYRWLGGLRSSLVFFALAALTYGVEYLGLVTGFPYGWFSYGELFGYKLFGLLPVLLPFACVPLVLGACAWSARVSKKGWVRVVYAALALVVFDLVLDPSAVALGVWSFADGGLFYGVPLSNFAGWIVSGVLASAVFFWLSGKQFVPQQLVVSAFLLLAFWTGVAAALSLWVPLALGVGVLFVLAHL